jgi:hypothetical protein
VPREAKHSPAPWKVETVPTSVGLCHRIVPEKYAGSRHGGICAYDDFTTLNPHPRGEQLANARLIAAVPDLLEQLMEAEGVIEGLLGILDGVDWGDWGPAGAPVLKDIAAYREYLPAIHTAIAKATAPEVSA